MTGKQECRNHVAEIMSQNRASTARFPILGAFALTAILFGLAEVLPSLKATKPAAAASITPLCDGASTLVSSADFMFLQTFQEALGREDVPWLADHFDFPVKLRCPDNKELVIRDQVSLESHLAVVFPPNCRNALLAIGKSDIRRTVDGVELGDTGVICLPVPQPEHEEVIKYLIYRTKYSARSEQKASDFYSISWTDKVFFMQVKEALRHNEAQWLAAHTRIPFRVCNAFGKKKFQASRSWFMTHYDDIWHAPRARIIPQTEQYKYQEKDLRTSLAKSLLNCSTMDLWKNWRGVMADNGTIWFWGRPSSGEHCYSYDISAINPVGTAWPEGGKK